MKSLTLSCAAALTFAAGGAGAADVGVSVEISQPGVYGRIDIGRFPQPQVIVPQPVIVARPAVMVAQPVQPVYMWVPPGHRKNWRKHCHAYNACGVPVYFVRHDWYGQHVQPGTYGRGRGGDDHRRGDDDHGRDRDRGPGHGKGHGKGRGG